MDPKLANGAGKRRGRKPIGPRGAVPFSASVPAELADEVDAVKGERTRSQVAVEALAAWVKRRKRA